MRASDAIVVMASYEFTTSYESPTSAVAKNSEESKVVLDFGFDLNGNWKIIRDRNKKDEADEVAAKEVK